MKRRTFCTSAVAAAVTATLSACGARQQAADPGPSISAMSMDGDELSIESAAVEELRGELDGRLFLQGDDGYDEAKLVWNGMFDHKKPSMVVQCASTDDVVDAVNFARERSLLVSVKGGGHSLPGKSTSDGGLMIDLAGLRSTDVDVDARTLRAGGGCLLGHLDDSATAHNLLTTTGIVAHTGCGGFTLGGGLGRTDRKMGLAVDNLLAATVVTADGAVVRASEEENSDLLWGLKGGGGNFGVVTGFTYRLHPFNPTVYGGDLWYDVDTDFLRYYGELHESLPDEANVEPILTTGPEGKPAIFVEVVWCGDHAAGEKALAGLLTAPGFLSGELAPFPYREIQTRMDGLLAHGVHSYLKSCFLTELSDDAIAVMVDYAGRGSPMGWWFQHMGGASARVAPDATAFANRQVAFNFGMMYWSNDPEQNEAGIAAVREIYAEIEPYSAGFYTNLHQEDAAQEISSNYGRNHGRLVELKNKYDPTNFFRLNANVQPTV